MHSSFTLKIYDLKNCLLRTITNITSDKIEIEKQNLISGIYFVILQSEKKIASGKLIIE